MINLVKALTLLDKMLYSLVLQEAVGFSLTGCGRKTLTGLQEETSTIKERMDAYVFLKKHHKALNQHLSCSKKG